jgi:hypothetical protein
MIIWNIPLTLAFAGLLTALGSYIDNHYISSPTRENIRKVLIRAFFVLEMTRIPDVARSIFYPLVAGRHNFI